LEVADARGTVVPRHPSEPWLPAVPRGTPRVLHALGTAMLAGGVLGWLGASAEVPWAPAAAAAAALTFVLPRIGWLLTAAGLIAVLVAGPVLFDAQAAGVAAA